VTEYERELRREVAEARLDLKLLEAGPDRIGRGAWEALRRKHQRRRRAAFERSMPMLRRGPWLGGSWAEPTVRVSR
jgi:hypothetical protein